MAHAKQPYCGMMIISYVGAQASTCNRWEKGIW
jgi:hypothetical protein